MEAENQGLSPLPSNGPTSLASQPPFPSNSGVLTPSLPVRPQDLSVHIRRPSSPGLRNLDPQPLLPADSGGPTLILILPCNLVLPAPALSSPRLQESRLPVPRTDLQPLTLPSEPPDLTPEERMELENIRRRKQELLVEIQRLREELSEAMSEVEGLEANEGR